MKAGDARALAPGALSHHVFQQENVVLEKRPKIFRRFRHAVDLEKFAHQAHIRAPGKFHALRAMMQAEDVAERARKRHRTRPARVNERAVNIKENQPDHAARKIAESLPGASF